MIDYPIARPAWGRPEAQIVAKVMTSRDTTCGAQVERFEHSFTRRVRTKHAVMVNSGSSADLVAAFALTTDGPLQQGAEVLVPAVTWPTHVWSLMMAGLKVRLVDVDPGTLNTNGSILEKAKTPETKAISPVHLLGNPMDCQDLHDLCIIYDWVRLDDVCESFGAKFKRRQVGTDADLATFSFFFSHQMTTMEGGMIVTNDDALARRCRLLRSHGWDRNPDYQFEEWGFNVRPLEVQGAFGTIQLRYFDRRMGERRSNYDLFYGDLADFMPIHPDTPGFAPMGVPLMFGDHDTRNRVRDGLRAQGVECRPIVAGNLARQPAARARGLHGHFPGADQVHHCGLYLGLHVDSEKDIIQEVCALVKGLVSGTG